MVIERNTVKEGNKRGKKKREKKYRKRERERGRLICRLREKNR